MLRELPILFPFCGDITLFITLFHANYLFCQSAPGPRPMQSTVCHSMWAIFCAPLWLAAK